MIERKKLTKNRSTAFFIAIFIAALFVSGFSPQFVEKVNAQALPVITVPVLDGFNLVQNTTTAVSTATVAEKESFLDGFGWAAGRVVIGNITNSIVSWINSGFQGGPAFVTDPQQFLTGVADQVAGEFIAGTELGFMCDPFQLEIRGALNFRHSSDFRINCSLSDVIANTEDFLKFTEGDFNQGGWEGWFSMTQNSNNNPYGAYAKAEAELSIRIAGAQNIELLKLDWGEGFFSWQDCLEPNSHIETDSNGNETSVIDEGCKTKGPVQTPGSVINSQLENVIGSPLDQLELADEINEIVGALAGQLVQQALIGGLSSIQSITDEDSSNSGISGYCESNRDLVSVGESVTWTAFGIGNNSRGAVYTWSGSPPIGDLASSTSAGTTSGTTSGTTGGGSRITVQYNTSGSKNARVRINVGSKSKTVNCSNNVTVQGIII